LEVKEGGVMDIDDLIDAALVFLGIGVEFDELPPAQVQLPPTFGQAPDVHPGTPPSPPWM
jgi:hypothetical protein